MIQQLTLTMAKEGDDWVGTCVELDLVTAGPDHWTVWNDLFNVCQAQIGFAVENDLTKELIRK